MGATIIAVANHKGGVGKTVTTVNLACALRRAGRRVLVVDTDAQCNTTQHLGFAGYEDTDNPTLYTEMSEMIKRKKRGKEPLDIKKAILHTEEDVDLIPGSILLCDLEQEMIAIANREKILSEFLNQERDNYDFIIMDSHSSLGVINYNVLTAADIVIIPLHPKYFSSTAMGQILSVIEMIKAQLNPNLKSYALFTCIRPNSPKSQKFMNLVETNYGNYVRLFSTYIPLNEAVDDATDTGYSVLSTAPNSPGAVAYKAVCEEFLGESFSMTPKKNLTLDMIDLVSAYEKNNPEPNGRYELVHGYSRLAAAQMLNLDTVPCEVIKITKDNIPIYRHTVNKEKSLED